MICYEALHGSFFLFFQNLLKSYLPDDPSNAPFTFLNFNLCPIEMHLTSNSVFFIRGSASTVSKDGVIEVLKTVYGPRDSN